MANSYNELVGKGSHAEDPQIACLYLMQDASGGAVDSTSHGKDGVENGSLSYQQPGPTNKPWLPHSIHFGIGNKLVLPVGSLGSDDLTLLLTLKIASDPPTDSTKTGIGRFGQRVVVDRSSHYPWTDGLAYDSTWRDNGSTLARVNGIATPYDLSQWRDLCIKTTPGSGGWKYRIDGNLIDSAVGLTGIATGSEFWIGHSRGSASQNYYLDGWVATCSIFSRHLSDAEESEFFAGPEPLNTVAPTLSFGASTWTGNVGSWDSQGNGTITYTWQLRRSSDNGVEQSGTGTATSIGGPNPAAGDYYLWVRAENLGGYDSAEDSVSSVETSGGGGGPTYSPIHHLYKPILGAIT